MNTCKPLEARKWFSRKAGTNWTITIVVFIVLLTGLAQFNDWWLAAIISGAGAFGLFFLYLDRRSIGIECGGCGRVVDSNTPWECGFKQCANENTHAFPFINECEHCHFIPKAYECHHCKRLIFLSKDKQDFQFAKILVIQKAAGKPAVVKDVIGDKIANQREAKRDLQHAYELTQLETNIILEKKRAIKPDELEQTRKELDRLYDKNMGKEDAGGSCSVASVNSILDSLSEAKASVASRAELRESRMRPRW